MMTYLALVLVAAAASGPIEKHAADPLTLAQRCSLLSAIVAETRPILLADGRELPLEVTVVPQLMLSNGGVDRSRIFLKKGETCSVKGVRLLGGEVAAGRFLVVSLWLEEFPRLRALVVDCEVDSAGRESQLSHFVGYVTWAATNEWKATMARPDPKLFPEFYTDISGRRKGDKGAPDAGQPVTRVEPR